MFIGELLIALVIALFLTFLLIGIFGWERPGTTGLWSSAIFVFFLIFLVSWAGGVWLQPFGWSIWGVYWLPFVAVGLIVALIIAAVSFPGRTRRSLKEVDPTEREVEDEEFRKSTAYAVGAFFWVVVILLGVAIATRYSI